MADCATNDDVYENDSSSDCETSSDDDMSDEGSESTSSSCSSEDENPSVRQAKSRFSDCYSLIIVTSE